MYRYSDIEYAVLNNDDFYFSIIDIHDDFVIEINIRKYENMVLDMKNLLIIRNKIIKVFNEMGSFFFLSYDIENDYLKKLIEYVFSGLPTFTNKIGGEKKLVGVKNENILNKYIYNINENINSVMEKLSDLKTSI